MRQTKQKRTKRRRTTMKRIKKNKVMYGGEIQRITTMSELNQVEKEHKTNKYTFQLRYRQSRELIVETDSINELKLEIKEKHVFNPNGDINDKFELVCY